MSSCMVNNYAGKSSEEDIDTDVMLEKELGYRKPGRWDLLPFVLYRCLIRSIKYSFNYVKDSKRRYKEKQVPVHFIILAQ